MPIHPFESVRIGALIVDDHHFDFGPRSVLCDAVHAFRDEFVAVACRDNDSHAWLAHNGVPDVVCARIEAFFYVAFDASSIEGGCEGTLPGSPSA